MNKFFEYISYILNHKWLVFKECIKLGIPFQGLVHDLSKFTPEEFFPYLERFYGKGKNKEEFREAWWLHIRRNPHHWQAWVAIGSVSVDNVEPTLEPIRMPKKYALEMLADWSAMGKQSGKKDIKEWYLFNRNKIILHYETRRWIEERLGI